MEVKVPVHYRKYSLNKVQKLQDLLKGKTRETLEVHRLFLSNTEDSRSKMDKRRGGYIAAVDAKRNEVKSTEKEGTATIHGNNSRWKTYSFLYGDGKRNSP